MQYRLYDPQKDQPAVRRIWRETGWIEDEQEERAQEIVLRSGRTLVADIDDEAECLVHSTPGAMRYLEIDVPFAAVMAVTTSRVARKLGLAGRLTAQSIALDAADGTAVSALGIFEQGYYNRLGYGNGSYEHWVRFDPAQLDLAVHARPPKRLTVTHAPQIHHALLNRPRGHGAVNIYPLLYTEADLSFHSKDFGLGYFDGEGGTLSHFIWANARGQNGPYRIIYMAYKNREQFLELMALLKSMGDQVRVVHMREPADIQLQDLMRHPFRQRRVTEKGEYATGASANAYWQVRICNLETCLAATHLPGGPLRFNLSLSDPITRYLEADAPWQGIAGEYVITFGPESEVRAGTDARLPTLAASVGAFSRLWLGVRPATGLAVTDDLRGPQPLLAALDETLRLPVPHLDYDL